MKPHKKKWKRVDPETASDSSTFTAMTPHMKYLMENGRDIIATTDLREKFKHLNITLHDLKKIVHEVDFIDLNPWVPDNEYDLEVQNIFELSHSSVTSVDDLAKITDTVFCKWFSEPHDDEENKRREEKIQYLKEELNKRIHKNNKKESRPLKNFLTGLLNKFSKST